MIWLLFILASLACGLLNPYVSLFCIGIVVQALFLAVCDANSVEELKLSKVCEAAGDLNWAKIRRTAVKRGLVGMCVAAVILFLLSSVMSVFAFLLWRHPSIGGGTDVPFDILGIKDNDAACVALLIAQVLCNLAGTVLIFSRRGSILKSDEAPIDPALLGSNEKRTVSISAGTVAAVAAAAVLGFFNPYMGWASLALHLLYPFAYGVIRLILWSYYRHAQLDGRRGYMGRYYLQQMCGGYGYNKAAQAAVWVLAAVLIFAAVSFSALELRIPPDLLSIDWGKMSWIPMSVAEVAAAFLAARDVRKIN